MISWLKYVPHSELVSHLAIGWQLSDELHFTNHGEYSVLMVWGGAGEPA